MANRTGSWGNDRTVDETGGAAVREDPILRWAAALLVLLLSGVAHAEETRVGERGSRDGSEPRMIDAVCPDARYVIATGPLVREDRSSDVLTVRGEEVTLGQGCEEGASSLTRTERGILLEAEWAGCVEGLRVNIEAIVDAATCESIDGVVSVQEAGKAEWLRFPLLALADTGESVRFGAFNTQYLPSTVFNKDPGDERVAAKKMSERIKKSGYDFIMLSEVFDDEAGEEFTKQLSNNGPYHHYVQEIDGDTVFAEQSGLAFYSKWPFVAPVDPGCDGTSCGGDCIGSGCGDLVFWTYHECDDTAWPWDVADCDADKGLALLRVENPFSGRIYNSLFTHTQASYPADDDESDEGEHFNTRRAQLGLSGYIINNHLPSGAERQDVFLMGDLNVDGNLNNPNPGHYWPTPSRFEFDYHFTSSNDYFQGYFIDPWQFETSPSGADPGLTNRIHYGTSGARLDYVARRAPFSPKQTLPGPRELCFQHMTLAYNLFWSDSAADYEPKGLGDGGKESLSDHYGVNVDANLWAPQCRPVEAKQISLSPGQPVVEHGQVTYPGSMQWWRIQEDGTYTVALVGLDTHVDEYDLKLYAESDLSTPVPQYENETNTIDLGRLEIVGQKFKVLEAPFYIRVKHDYRTYTGDYALVVLRHDCGSKEQSCALRPGEEMYLHQLPQGGQAASPEAWFDLETDGLPPGVDPQELQFTLHGLDNQNDGLYTLSLLEDDGVSVVDSDASGFVGEGGVMVHELARAETAERKFFLTVERNHSGPYVPLTETAFLIGWTTNLSILYPGTSGLVVQSVEENDSTSGDDEVVLAYVRVDGHHTQHNHMIDDDWDAGEDHSIAHIIGWPIYFYGDVTIRLIEEDDTSGNDWLDFVVEALPLDQALRLVDEQLYEPFDTGGLYLLRHSVSHFLP